MFGLVWWMFAAGPVAACSCAPYTDDEALAESDVAFVGTLQEIRVPDNVVTWSSDDPVRFLFAVTAVYKGEAFEQQSVVTARDGASCGLEVQRWPDSVGVRGGPRGQAWRRGRSPRTSARGLVRSVVCRSPTASALPMRRQRARQRSELTVDGGWMVDMWIGGAIVIAALGLAGAGIVLGRRARRA